jgi:TolB protein
MQRLNYPAGSSGVSKPIYPYKDNPPACGVGLRSIKALTIAAALVCLLLVPKPGAAKVYIDLEAPATARLPIAVQEFRYTGRAPDNAEDAEEIEVIKRALKETLEADLDFSGLFNVIDSAAFLEEASEAGLGAKDTNFGEWRMIGADALIKGGFKIAGKKLTVEIRFFDTIKEKRIIGRRYIGNSRSPTRLSHYFADQLYRKLTGKKGIFSTKLLFISNSSGNKEVYLSDYNGDNARQITRNGSINLSPQWSPDGKKIIYTSYKDGCPCLYLLDLRSGRDHVISNKDGLNIGGRFSPSGDTVALTMSGRRSPEIYLLELDSKKYKRLTNNYSIDVSPSWSPDGEKIAYVSDISGNPHIFMLDLDTNRRKRLTYSGNYNSSPAWSPDGKMIAFARANSGSFDIWAINSNGIGGAKLTRRGNNKAPSWSPDSRFIVFSSTQNGASSLYIIRADGTGLKKITTGVGNETTPTWSPYLQ